MSDWMLLDTDPYAGSRQYVRPIDDQGGFELRTVSDVEPVLENNKSLANADHKRGGELWHAASIPASICLKWLVEEGIDVYDKNHAEAVKRKLNSNEYRYLRTREFII